MRKILVFIFLIPIILGSCKRDFGTYYDPPSGQMMIYDQLRKDSVRFSTFIAAVDQVPGLKTELSSSGLYTVMAPDNGAFDAFFSSHPRFKSLKAIPADTLEMIVKYHILKFMFYQDNFLNPGVTQTEYDKFKYETRANLVYKERGPSGQIKALYYQSKLLNIYTANFFNWYGVTSQDYTDVYGAGSAVATKTGVNVNGSAFTEKDISSGNGVVHIIDKVLMPPPTIAQELDNNSEFSRLNTIMKKQFVTYTYNSAATKAQGNNGDVDGDGRTDSLWNRSYAFSSYIDNENPKLTTQVISLSAYIPSKSAFDDYVDNKLVPNFANNVDSIPNRTFKLLYQAFFSHIAYWPSKIGAGRITNLLGDISLMTKSDISNVKMVSNGVFYKTNKVLEPNAFTGVTGPSFLNLKYWYFGEMLLRSGVLSGLTKTGTKFTILCPTNKAFQNHGIFYDPAPGTGGAPGFFRVIPPSSTAVQLSTSQIASIVNNHIIYNKDLSSTAMVDGFYTTLNNSIIIVEAGKVHGFYQDTLATINVANSNKQGFNGYFHEVDKAILNPQQSIYDIINSASLYNAVPPLVRPEYTKFKELVKASGLLYKDFLGTTAVDADKKFTLFVPSNTVITDAQVAGILPKTGAVLPILAVDAVGRITDLVIRARLAEWVKYFFVQDNQVLTNGSVTGTLLTSRLDPISTTTNPVFVPVSVTYSAGTINFKSFDTPSVTGNVLVSNKVLYPYNTIAKDGLLQIIDNAFTSKY